MILRGFGRRGEQIPDCFFTPKTRQVHGARVVHIVSEMGGDLVEADAFVATEPGVLCAVATADCVPVLLWDANERIVAAIHAGWRGVAAKILSEAVHFMRQRVPDISFRVAMGPAMGANCYEVGEDVVAACGRTVATVATHLQSSRPGHHYIDLKGILTEQLNREGIATNCIEADLICTHCDERYASFRRGDRSERQYSWIVISD